MNLKLTHHLSGRPRLVAGVDGLLEVREDVRDALQAHGEADKAIRQPASQT